MNYHKNLDLTDIVYFCEFDLIEKTEQWKDVPNYEGIYQVSDLGRVKSLNYRRSKKSKILKQGFSTHKYLLAGFYNGKLKTFKIHQLVAIAFLNHKPCGHKLVVNHKDFNRSNNYVKNLEIITNRENSNLKHIPSTSQYVGVCWDKKIKRWRSSIVINNKYKYLGVFISEIDAHNTYQNALLEIEKTS